jgi:Tol biopolymer transport system component
VASALVTRSFCVLALLSPWAPKLLSEDAPRWRLVYERTRDGNADLFLQSSSGEPERRLTDDPAEDLGPRFTPDGQRVLFSSKRSGEWQIYEVDAAGGRPRRLRNNGFREWQADPARDGTRLAFLSNASGREALWVMDRRGAARLLLQHGARTILGNPHWSPDGTRIVLSSNYGLAGHRTHVVDVATGKSERISPLTSGACEPHWSPDGLRVAYVRREHATRSRSRIVEVELASGRERMLVEWPGLNYDPAYSPDGSEIAFASTTAGEFAIYRMRLSDGRSWRVTTGPGPARHPDYGRD